MTDWPDESKNKYIAKTLVRHFGLTSFQRYQKTCRGSLISHSSPHTHGDTATLPTHYARHVIHDTTRTLMHGYCCYSRSVEGRVRGPGRAAISTALSETKQPQMSEQVRGQQDGLIYVFTTPTIE